jgi:transketolase
MDPLAFEAFWHPFRSSTRRVPDCLPFHAEHPRLLASIETLAYLVRSYTVWEMTCGGLGHPGGSLSQAETLAVLFDYALRYDPAEPGWPLRDVFYLSKCHTAPALYTVMALAGYFPLKSLQGYGRWGSGFESHPDALLTPGIEASGGSLGQIPGMAVGRALAIQRRGPDHASRMVYALLGDGECNEGSVWEAFMAAGHYGLDNLAFLIDANKVQAKGFVSREMSIEPLAAKLAAFNLDVQEVGNGHDVAALVDLFTTLRQRRRGRPLAAILHTVKGKKVAEAEFNPNWHTSAPRSAAQAALWLEELWELDGRRLGIPAEFPGCLARSIEIVPPLHGNPDEVSERQA